MSEATHVSSGKVREIYALDEERLLLVASDRISTFDVVLPTEIPDKGRVLTGLSGFWFTKSRAICPNHLLALRQDGRSSASCEATWPARAGRITGRAARCAVTASPPGSASRTVFPPPSSRRPPRR